MSYFTGTPSMGMASPFPQDSGIPTDKVKPAMNKSGVIFKIIKFCIELVENG